MNKRPTDRLRSTVYKVISAFGVGIVCGAIGIPGVNRLIFGDLDPFARGWPILDVSAFVFAALITVSTKHAFVAALGIYVGLVAVIFTFGNPEYPLATIIALAVHGLVPALLACGLGGCLRHLKR